MIIDCISDLHGHYPKLEGGDLLIVAGDLTANHSEKEFSQFFDWLYKQDYKGIVFIAGNHDVVLEKYPLFHNESNPNRIIEITRNAHVKVQHLCDSGAEFEGFKIWGSPWTLTFEGMNPNCKAFTVDSEKELAKKWALIPEDVNILITHCPPFGYLDEVKYPSIFKIKKNVGSKSLIKRLKELQDLKYHFFGHIHEDGGKMGFYLDDEWKGCVFANASHVNEHYQPVNKPIRVIL